MALEKTLLKAKTELDNGNMWRAKEILQSSINIYGYNPELFEFIGIVLLKMNDFLDAGRYLFLSGVEKSEYNEPIELFRMRYFKNKDPNLYRIIPKAAQLKNLSDYPEKVYKELKAQGYPELVLNSKQKYNWQNKNSPFKEFIHKTIPPLLIVGFLLIILLGFVKSCELLF